MNENGGRGWEWDRRGNLRVAKTPPLQSGVGGDIIAIQIRPLPSSMETRKLYNDAARRVATSSEERENRF